MRRDSAIMIVGGDERGYYYVLRYLSHVAQDIGYRGEDACVMTETDGQCPTDVNIRFYMSIGLDTFQHGASVLLFMFLPLNSIDIRI